MQKPQAPDACGRAGTYGKAWNEGKIAMTLHPPREIFRAETNGTIMGCAKDG